MNHARVDEYFGSGPTFARLLFSGLVKEDSKMSSLLLIRQSEFRYSFWGANMSYIGKPQGQEYCYYQLLLLLLLSLK